MVYAILDLFNDFSGDYPWFVDANLILPLSSFILGVVMGDLSNSFYSSTAVSSISNLISSVVMPCLIGKLNFFDGEPVNAFVTEFIWSIIFYAYFLRGIVVTPTSLDPKKPIKLSYAYTVRTGQ